MRLTLCRRRLPNWFGSSAGVAVAGQFHQARSVWSWLRHGWNIPVAYVVGLSAMQLLLGWHPDHMTEVSPGGH
jgi:hypothetical protein